MNPIDSYILAFDEPCRSQLLAMRKLLQKHLPEAVEEIKYGIPTYVIAKNIIHFGGAKNHVGLYPGTAAVNFFATDLANYKTSKGTIQFSLHEALPSVLIGKIVAFCLAQTQAKSKPKK